MGVGGRISPHPYEWNDHGEMNHFIGKPIERLYGSGGSFEAVIEREKGKFKVVANSKIDGSREYWAVDYKDIIYDYPVE